MRTVLWLTLCVCAAMIGTGGAATAADFPNKPIQLVVPYAAGGSTDLLARAVGQVAPKHFPVPVVVVNKAGGGGIPGRVDVVRAKPDGYNVLFGYGSGEDIVVPHQRQLPFDVFKDWEPVCRISIHSVVMVVPASSPHKTAQEFVAWAKTKDNVVGAVGTKGGAADISMHAFATAGGFKLTTVPGSGGGEAVTRLVGGHADMGGFHPSEVLPHIKAGRLRAIGVALDKRDPSIETPTLREAGYDVVTAGSVKGMAVAKGTPKEIITYLADKCKAVTEDPDFARVMKELGQPINFQGPEEYRTWLKQASDTYATLLKTLGIETK
jgi:tripartite-type tricarboxylate transporter receptor subunit TctC